MPTGVLVNVLSALVGSGFGCLLSKRIPEKYQQVLPVLFGFCAMAIGIKSIVNVASLTAPVLAILIGYCLGSALKLEERCINWLQAVLPKAVAGTGALDMPTYITVVALFCFSGFGWYGVLAESIGGVPDILYSKSVLDFFTAMLFAAMLGKTVCLIPIAQAIVFALLFLLGKVIAPHIDAVTFANLTACGGILTLATGFRVAKIKSVPVIDMTPALVIVLVLAKVLA